MATIRELVVSFGFDVDEKPLREMEKSIDTLTVGFAAVAAAAAGAFASIFGLAKTTANYADEIKDTSLAIGVSADELQRLAYASQLSGGGIEVVSDGLRFLSRNAAAAIGGSKETAEAFAALGIQLTDSNGQLRPTAELLLDAADAFKKMGPGAKATAASMELFGRSGAKMIPMLIEGREGIAAMGAEAEAFGAILGDEAIAQGQALNDSLDRLKATAMGIVRTLGAGLFPVVSEVTNSFQQWMIANRELVKTRIQKFIEVMQSVLKNIWRVTYAVARAFFGLADGVSTLVQKISWLVPLLKIMAALFGLYLAGKVAMALFDVAKGFLMIGRAAMAANLKVMAIPILIGAAIALVLLAVEDLFAFLDGRPSFLGFLVKNSSQILGKLKEILGAVVSWMQNAVGKVATGIAKFFGVPAEQAQQFGEIVKGAFGGLVEYIKGTFSSVFDIFGGLFKIIESALGIIVRGLVALVTDPVGAIIGFFKGDGLKAFLEFSSVIWEQGKKIAGAIWDLISRPFKMAGNLIGKLLPEGISAKFGIGDDAAFGDAGFPSFAQTATTNNAAPVSNNMQSTINVTVPPGSDAEAIGSAVQKAAGSEFDRILRQSQRATAPAVEY